MSAVTIGSDRPLALPSRIRLTGQELRTVAESGAAAAGPLAALRVLTQPEVTVSLDVSVRRSAMDYSPRVVSRQCCRDGLVATLSTAGCGVFELSWLPAELWRFELARAATVTFDSAACPPPPPGTELPYELMLAAATCLRGGREDMLGELLGRYAANVRVGSKLAAADDPAAVVRAVVLAATARLRATVLVEPGQPPGPRRVGVAHWLGFADGWRRLEPFLRGDLPMVRLRPAQPADLGADVARLLTGVRR